MHHWLTNTEIYFSGGWMGDWYTESWSFVVDRLSAKGNLKLEERDAGTYQCARVKTQL
ncbi:hypothetical protein [Rhodobacter sp. CZR27]|uniref:hypothetical protein n=1 Tax=Rhodobacter sp. CZR27 TaxID=2033869 RepID=UPI0012FE67E5|nr:hypothetical protein [Rhodobacter sp. CZR27]